MNYITKDGDRIDSLAYKFLKNPNRYREILKLNPLLTIASVLEPGRKIQIPNDPRAVINRGIIR